ncbi:hypothetical protein [Spirosoma validum]|uniref:Uncharacterized protein n=1 Tax=Spirosoma validum TaxID=2771355 RepID=A0A927AZ55_9BACT|nr:hypothetical protein [Spirosoma validum]MBD2752337.1 hypothetical protein [Spirosoma validum]
MNLYSFRCHRLTGLFLFLMISSALAQKPFKPTEPHFDPKQPIPKIKINCLLANGQPRKYPCEFIVTKFEVINSPQSVLNNVGWNNQSATLLLSKAKSIQNVTISGKPLRYCTYDVELTFLRIAPPAKPTSTYDLRLYPRPKGAESTLLSDLLSIPGAPAKPALSIPVGQKQTVTVPLTLLIDPSNPSNPLFVVNPISSTTGAPSIDVRMYLHNMATTASLPQNAQGYQQARDYAEWSASISLLVKP